MATSTPSRTGPARGFSRWHWRIMLGGCLVMMGGSIVLSGLSFIHPYVIQELFPQRNGAFLWYYTFTLLSMEFPLSHGRLSAEEFSAVTVVFSTGDCPDCALICSNSLGAR